MSAPAAVLPNGPLIQSVRIAFRALYLATLLLALGWLGSNIRQVPPDSRAVVLRFGQVDRVQQAGLLLAWPQPIERVELLPAADRQIELRFDRPAETAVLDDLYVKATREAEPPANLGFMLTGDGGVVRLDAALFYRITDPVAYMVAGPHVTPALQRLFVAGTVALAAARELDDFLVARPDRPATAGADPSRGDPAALRAALRGDLVRIVNRRLQDLQQRGAGLGVEVSRIDLTASLPQSAKAAFDGVLTADQLAEQRAAARRTEAVRTLQEAARERDRILTAASAAGAERISDAAAKTAEVAALESRIVPESRAGLLDQIYRDRIAAILRKAGQVTAVDGRGGARLILPGAKP